MGFDLRRAEEHSKGSFTAWDGDTKAGEMTYSRGNPTLVIVDHTDVMPGFEGRGVGKQLVAAAVAWARESGQKIMPLCPFARATFERTKEYADVWFK
jgi:predicted GNAT family acetyltransferase